MPKQTEVQGLEVKPNGQAPLLPDADYELKIAYGQVLPAPKPWYTSKTLWFNGAIAVVGAVSTVVPHLQPYVNPQTFGVITAGIALANTALRLVTTQPVGGSRS